MNNANFAAIISNATTRKGLKMVPNALASLEAKKAARVAKKEARVILKARKSAADRDRRIEATIKASSFHNQDVVREVLRLTDDVLMNRKYGCKYDFTFQILNLVIQELFKLRAWNGEPCIATMHKIVQKHIRVNGFDVALHPRRRPFKVKQ